MAHNTDAHDRILETITFVREAVQLLERQRALDTSASLEGVEERAIVERNFQTAIEACIDIAELLIVEFGESMPITHAEKFLRLEDQGIVSSQTAEKMPEAVGFRNVLAYQYGPEIGAEQVYRHLRKDLEWFPTFCREIHSFRDGELPRGTPAPWS